MTARYAIFEGHNREGLGDAFRYAVLEKLLPTWKAFPGASSVRVSFATGRVEGAPEYPPVLAVDHPDQARLDAALARQAPVASRAATRRVFPRFLDNRIHHHVTAAHAYAVP